MSTSGLPPLSESSRSSSIQRSKKTEDLAFHLLKKDGQKTKRQTDNKKKDKKRQKKRKKEKGRKKTEEKKSKKIMAKRKNRHTKRK